MHIHIVFIKNTVQVWSFGGEFYSSVIFFFYPKCDSRFDSQCDIRFDPQPWSQCFEYLCCFSTGFFRHK